MKPRRCRTGSLGFSLIEVLIAILVIATSMLGFAAVQAVSISNTTVARYQSLAAIQVSSIAAAMSANPGYWEALPAAVTICVGTVGNSAVTQEIAANGTCAFPLTAGAGALNSQSTNCTQGVCSATALAASDLKTWATGLQQPGAFAQALGTIACSAAGTTPVSCLVTLSWSEKNVSLVNPTGKETGALANGQTVRNSYSQVVQP